MKAIWFWAISTVFLGHVYLPSIGHATAIEKVDCAELLGPQFSYSRFLLYRASYRENLPQTFPDLPEARLALIESVSEIDGKSVLGSIKEVRQSQSLDKQRQRLNRLLETVGNKKLSRLSDQAVRSAISEVYKITHREASLKKRLWRWLSSPNGEWALRQRVERAFISEQVISYLQETGELQKMGMRHLIKRWVERKKLAFVLGKTATFNTISWVVFGVALYLPVTYSPLESWRPSKEFLARWQNSKTSNATDDTASVLNSPEPKKATGRQKAATYIFRTWTVGLFSLLTYWNMHLWFSPPSIEEVQVPFIVAGNAAQVVARGYEQEATHRLVEPGSCLATYYDAWAKDFEAHHGVPPDPENNAAHLAEWNHVIYPVMKFMVQYYRESGEPYSC